MAVLVVFAIGNETYGFVHQEVKYNLSAQAQQIIGATNPLYAKKLSYDSVNQQYKYNDGYTAGQGMDGDSMAPRITATFNSAKNKNAVTVSDPVNKVDLTITPKFAMSSPKSEENRLIYPIDGKNALKVYTLKGSGVKEDIVLEKKPSKDTMQFDYEVSLPSGVELRAEGDGSLAAYGVQSMLLGNVTASSEKDSELLQKARENGEKNNLLFRIPAPFVVGANKKQSNARAWFSLNGNALSLHVSGLHAATYPLSIDPTIYVETAAKFMRGNNETNVDFDTTNELIQKSQTTGARIDGWADSTDMTAGLWDHSIATAGGYIYRAGGRTDPTIPHIVGQQATVQATNSTSFVMNMPTVRPAGDLYVALIAHDGSGTDVVPPDTDWVEYADTREHAAYYRIGKDISGGNEAASYTWTGASEQWAGVIIRIQGFNSGSPISGTAGTGNSASAAVPVLPATTPAHDATLVIRSVGVNADQPSDYTWLPNGHTKIYSGTSSTDTANSAALVAMSLDQPPLASNSTGTTSLVNDGIMNDTYGASTIAIRPATVTPGYQNTVEWAQFNSATLAIDSPNPGTGACTGWCNNSAYNLPANRVGMSMVAYNGYLYALGGTPDGTAANGTNTVWVAKLGANGEPQLWHPSGGTPGYWYVSTNTLPAALSYTSIAAYKNKLYLVGGKNTSGTSINEVRIADLLPTGDIGPWTTAGAQNLSTPGARFGHSVHVYNDTMYLIGGNNNGTLLNTNYYSKLNNDGTMNPWVQTTSLTTGRASFGGQMTAVWGAYIYLGGGCTALTSGYCSTIASDVQLASINADGTLAPWNPILNLSNQRIGYDLAAWQGGLYRLGGCNRQNTTTGVCYATHQNVDFGPINPAGDASTVRNSTALASGTCIAGSNPTNCDLPPAGDGIGAGGQMSSMVVVNNGYIYNIGGCVVPSGTCSSDMSGNVSYAALNSVGQMVSPATCPPQNSTYGLWCVDSTYRINGTNGLAAAGATVFNNVIYVAGGVSASTWQSTMYRVMLNSDGSLSGAWQTQTFAGIGAGSARGYMYMFSRANPAAASTTPGNLYMLGGCSGASGIGCSTYFTDTLKCNILADSSVSGCSATGQMQVDADNITGGNQGLGLMAGTLYANRLYLVGGSCADTLRTGGASDPCGSTYAANRKDTIYAAIDSSNNIVDATSGSSSGTWKFTTAQMNPVRRRAVAFGYNGYIYSLAGFSGSASLQDLLFAKIDVSTGDLGAFDNSGVVVTPRWDLRAVVSNGYVYAIGGCGAGAAPSSCTSMQPQIQTFQLYNNNSGTPASFAASANQFATDRMGASSTILNGYLYVAGGCISNSDCTTSTNSVEYSAIDSDGNLGAWATGGSLPANRVWGQLETVGGTLYYIGGQVDSSNKEQPTVYYTTGITAGNPTWSASPATNSLPDDRTQFSAAVWDDRIYVTGGQGSTPSVYQATVYVSPKLSAGGDITSAWTTSTPFNVPRTGHTTIAYANNIYVIGGFDGTNYLSDVQFASIGYKAGTISQSGVNVTGSGTAWTAAMVGSKIQYRDGETATIVTVPTATTMTVSVSKTVTAGSGYTVLDGSVGPWKYTTSLPEPIRQADGYAANGYMYLVGGRSASGDCIPNILLSPISANTTIAAGNNGTGVGEWYETNVKYLGDRYGNSVSYKDGKLYTLGGACESFPMVSSVNGQSFATDATTHSVTMPATVDTGDLLLVLLTTDGGTGATVTTPAGWTLVATGTEGANVRGSVFAKDADGTEDGAGVNFATSVAEQAAAQVYKIPAAKWEGTIASVEAASATGSSTNAPNPPNLNPNGWNAESTLWLSYVAASSYATVTSYPTYHTNLLHTVAGAGTTGATATSTQRQNDATAEDPGAYAMPTTSSAVPFTIAIRPSTFMYTGANRVVQTSLYSQPQVAAYSRLIDTDTDVFPTKWLMNGLDNSIGARWQARYSTMHDISDGASQQNPNEDCGSSATMPLMTTWGQETNFGNVTLGQPETYTPLSAGGANINCGRYFYFFVSIDASQTFGYPEDVNRGPTISDLSLFFTSDPSKRMRHGKTFTGGELQPLDTPFP